MRFTFIVPLLIFCSIGLAADQQFSRTDEIVFALSPRSAPEEDSLYSLNGMRVLQTVNDGVLMQVTPDLYRGTLEEPAIAFLYTNEKFVDGKYLHGYWGYWTGTYVYESVLGVKKSIYAFTMYDKQKSSTLNQEIQTQRDEQRNQINIGSYAQQLVKARLQNVTGAQWVKQKEYLIEIRFCQNPSIVQTGESRWTVSSCLVGENAKSYRHEKVTKRFTVDLTILSNGEAQPNDIQIFD